MIIDYEERRILVNQPMTLPSTQTIQKLCNSSSRFFPPESDLQSRKMEGILSLRGSMRLMGRFI